MNLWRSFSENQNGAVAIIFSLAVPVVLGTAALAIDSATFYNHHARIQDVADSAALATAKELHVYRSDAALLGEVGKSRAESLLADKGLAGFPHTVTVNVDKAANTVLVTVQVSVASMLPVGLGSANTLSATSEAKAFGQFRLCVLGLHPSQGETLKGESNAALTAPDCSVQSNSTDPNGLLVKTGAKITSTVICSSGGVSSSGGTLEPKPRTDCPPLDDPLAARDVPASTGCDYLDRVISGGKHSISPGSYCGGLKIEKDAEVTVEPGTYVISGGKLEMSGKSILQGENASFYFEDNAATFYFHPNTIIDLTAPKDGPMAGMLFFENPTVTAGHEFTIKTAGARRLLGTIYLPKGTLKIDAKGSVAELSAYTVIVARRIEVREANLIVNSDYGGTDVPVPGGLGPSSGQVRLFH